MFARYSITDSTDLVEAQAKLTAAFTTAPRTPRAAPSHGWGHFGDTSGSSSITAQARAPQNHGSAGRIYPRALRHRVASRVSPPTTRYRKALKS
jgi:hypothetical protein